MRSIKDYRLEEKSYRNATLFAVFLIIVYLIFRFLLDININIYQNPIKILGLATIQILFYIGLLFSRVIAVIWTYKIAQEKERNGIFWAFTALIIPPIALIAVANRREKYENEKIENIVEETRSEYNTKTSEIYNNHSMSKEEQNDTIEKIKNDYERILKDRLVEVKADSLIEQIQILREQDALDISFDSNLQKQVLICDITNNLNNNEAVSLKCPACNSLISNESIICSECEIILK